MLLLIVFSKLCLYCTNPGVFKEIFETKSNITFWTFFFFLFQIYHCIMTAPFLFPSTALVLLPHFFCFFVCHVFVYLFVTWFWQHFSTLQKIHYRLLKPEHCERLFIVYVFATRTIKCQQQIHSCSI